MNKNSIWFLKTMLEDFEEASLHFKDYLNSYNKKSWDLYNRNSLSWFGYAVIIDKKLMLSKSFNHLRKLIKTAKKQYNYSDYAPTKHKDSDISQVLSILAYLKKETQILLELEIKRLNLEDKISKKVA